MWGFILWEMDDETRLETRPLQGPICSSAFGSSLYFVLQHPQTQRKRHPILNNSLATDKQFSLCFPSWRPRANFPGVVTKPVSSHSQCWGLLCEPKERFNSVFCTKFNIHNWPEFITKNVWNETRTISKTWKIYIQLEVDQDDLFVQQCWENIAL